MRVLDLQPDEPNSMISCVLREVRLSANPAYECISYTWGHEPVTKDIELNGTLVRVRPNLWNFFKRLRQQDSTRAVWVDALCISQTDLEEKAQQVQMIGQIFKQAVGVLAWIGEGSEGIREIIHLARRNERSKRDISSAFEELVMQPYWTRTWVVQEVVLGQSVLVWCGDDYVSWDQLFEFISSPGVQTSPDGLTYMKFIGIRRNDFRRPPKHELDDSLCALLLDFSGTKCENPLDKVYAILSLEKRHSWQKPIMVDYTIEPADLYLKVMVDRYEDTWEEMKDIFPEVVGDSLELSLTGLQQVACKLPDSIRALAPGRRKDIFEFVIQYLLRKEVVEQIAEGPIYSKPLEDKWPASLVDSGYRLKTRLPNNDN
jgi:hypothetical protein